MLKLRFLLISRIKLLKKWNSWKNVTFHIKLVGKEIHAWNEILKKINEYVSKGNNAMVAFNDKVAALMTKMMGF